MSKKKINENETISDPYEIKIFDQLLYIKFGETLVEAHLERLDGMVKTVVGLEELVQVFVFDLYSLKTFDIRCVRALVLAQNNVRQKSGFKLTVVEPQEEGVRKLLVDKMVVRKEECMASREELVLHLKRLMK